MRPQLEELITHAVHDLVKRLWYPYQSKQVEEASSSLADHYASRNLNDEIAVKVAIQFCIAIEAYETLFINLFKFFEEYHLETKFYASIEP